MRRLLLQHRESHELLVTSQALGDSPKLLTNHRYTRVTAHELGKSAAYDAVRREYPHFAKEARPNKDTF